MLNSWRGKIGCKGLPESKVSCVPLGVSDQLVPIPRGVTAVLAKVPLVSGVVSDQVLLEVSLFRELFGALGAGQRLFAALGSSNLYNLVFFYFFFDGTSSGHGARKRVKSWPRARAGGGRGLCPS